MSCEQGGIEVSVVAAMHNEEACAREFCERVSRSLKEAGFAHEIIVVDDGSTDDTEVRLRRLCDEIPEMVVLSLARNHGQWAALYAGFQESRGAFVVMMDADLQHRPEDIPLLVRKAMDGYDLVSGSRSGRQEPLLTRRLPSAVANFLLRKTTGCQVRDMGGFKCVRGDLVRSMRLRAGFHRLMPALVHAAGGRVTEIEVPAPPRFAGKSHYGLSRTFEVCYDILLLWFQSAFKSRPLYFFGHVSMILFGLTGLIWVWLLYEKIIHGVPMGTRPPFLASIMLFLAALGFLAAGFVLEMLSEVLHALTDAKPYVIKSRYPDPEGRG